MLGLPWRPVESLRRLDPGFADVVQAERVDLVNGLR